MTDFNSFLELAKKCNTANCVYETKTDKSICLIELDLENQGSQNVHLLVEGFEGSFREEYKFNIKTDALFMFPFTIYELKDPICKC